MPIVIPTSDEIARMSARQRDSWRRRMGITLQAAAEARQSLEFGVGVRTAAEALLWGYGFDRDAALHRDELLEALR